jgi:hypothetical protein
MVIPAPTVPVAIVFAPGAVFVVETKYSYPFAGIDVDAVQETVAEFAVILDDNNEIGASQVGATIIFTL